MKRTVFVSVLALMTAMGTGAFAGSLADPIVEPMPVAPLPVVTDWDGFYAGFTAGMLMGEATTGGVAAAELTYDLEGYAYGAFAGYNVQNGAMVYGGEVMAQMGTITVDGTDYDLDYLIDARLRVGYAMDDVLVYAAGGYSLGQATVGADSVSADGWNVGAGVQFYVTDSVFVGGEYVHRWMSGDYNGTPFDATLGSIQVRVGMQF